MTQPIPIFSGDIVSGKLKLLERERESIRRWTRTFKTGTKVDILIRKHRTKRSNEQNRYYWGVVLAILADHFGYDSVEECHEDMKRMFNPTESKIQPGVIVGGSTTKMSTEEFFCGETSYVERICRWSAVEHGVFIPPPGKVEP